MGTQKRSDAELQAEIDSSKEALLAALSPHEIRMTFAPGEVLFRQDSWPDAVFVLRSGSADLQFRGKGEPGVFGIHPGTILGLSSLVSDRPHEYTASTAEDVTVGYVDRATFFKVLNDTPARWFDVLRILSRDIVSCYDRVKEMALAHRTAS